MKNHHFRFARAIAGGLAAASRHVVVAGVLWAGLAAGAVPLASVRQGELRLLVSAEGHFSLDCKGVPIIRDGSFYLTDKSWTRLYPANNEHGLKAVVSAETDAGLVRVTGGENAYCTSTQSFRVTKDTLTYELECEVKPATKTATATCDIFFNKDIFAGATFQTDAAHPVSGKLDPAKAGTVFSGFTQATLNTAIGDIQMSATAQAMTAGVAKPNWVFRNIPHRDWGAEELRTFSLLHTFGAVPAAGMKYRLAVSLKITPASDAWIFSRGMERGLKAFKGTEQGEALLSRLPTELEARSKALQAALDAAAHRWQGEQARARQPAPQPLIIPQPQQMELGKGSFVVKPGVVILTPPELSTRERMGVETLVQELQERFGIAARVRPATAADSLKGAIVLGEPARNPVAAACLKRWKLAVTPAAPGPEGYVLRATPDGVVVSGSDAAGTFYGIQSLIQLLRRDANGGVSVPEAAIRDWPEMKWRGMCIESGQPEEVRRLIRRMAARYKLNSLMFSGGYNSFQWKSHPEVTPSGKGMTMEEYGQIAQYARDHFLEFIPFFHTFGHVNSLRASHPEIAERPDEKDGSNDAYCPLNPATHKLVFDLYQEALDAAKPRYVNIGHDEISPIGVCDLCKGKTHQQLFAGDVILIHDWLKARGVQTIIWGDMLLRKDWRRKGVFFNYANGTTDAAHPDGTDKAIDLLPKDIIIADWQYGPLPPSAIVPAGVTNADLVYPTVRYFVDKGFRVLGCPWYDRINNYYLAESVRNSGALGLVVTDWGLFATKSASATSVLGAEYAWTPGRPALEQLPYDPIRVLAEQLRPRRPSDALDAVFTPLDIAAQANRRITCTDSSDRQSWFGEGAGHDLWMLRGGKQTLEGIDFLIPADTDGAGKCLLLGPVGGTAAPANAKVPIARRADSLLVLTALTVSEPRVQNTGVARMTARYQDGTTAMLELKENLHVTDWRTFKLRENPWRWREGYEVLFGAKLAFRGFTRFGEAVNLQACEWVNPDPDKPIASLEWVSLRKDLEFRLAILGVTAVSAKNQLQKANP